MVYAAWYAVAFCRFELSKIANEVDMGDMSRCKHGDFVGYCSKCNAVNWQPIETAPRDGTRILGWYNGVYERNIGEYVVVFYSAIPYRTWFDSTGMPIDGAPDKWMPLPPPPEAT